MNRAKTAKTWRRRSSSTGMSALFNYEKKTVATVKVSTWHVTAYLLCRYGGVDMS